MSEIYPILFFPNNVKNQVITDFLNLLYPDLSLRVLEVNNKMFIVKEDLLGRINARLISITSGFVNPGFSFELIPNEDWIEVSCTLSEHQLNSSDPFLSLSRQFAQEWLFDLFEYLNPDHFHDYFQGLISMLKEDYRTAASKFALVGESLGKTILSTAIPVRLKDFKGFEKIKKILERDKSFSDFINIVKTIKKELPDLSTEQKKSLDVLFHAFHLFRELRNRAQHADEPRLELQAQCMLSLLLYIHEEVSLFIKPNKIVMTE